MYDYSYYCRMPGAAPQAVVVTATGSRKDHFTSHRDLGCRNLILLPVTVLSVYTKCRMPIDPNSPPEDSEALQKVVLNLLEQLDRSLANQDDHQSLLSELLKAQPNSNSERLPTDHVSLLEAARGKYAPCKTGE